MDSQSESPPPDPQDPNQPSGSGNHNHGNGIERNPCLHCNGFYGVSFDVLCTTCHDFLYADDYLFQRQRDNNFPEGQRDNLDHLLLGLAQTETEKDDGEDSGNDEPSEDGPPVPVPIIQSPELEPSSSEPGSQPSASSPSGAGSGSPNNAEDESRARRLEPQPVVLVNGNPIFSGPDRFVLLESEDARVDVGGWNIDVSAQAPSTSTSGRQSAMFPDRDRDSVENRIKRLSTPLKLQPYEISPIKELTDLLPPEIWGIIFEKLDPFSLIMASKAKSGWKKIITGLHGNEYWRGKLMEMWPLFNPIYEVRSWFEVYAAFMSSVACKLCWIKIIEQKNSMNRTGVPVVQNNSGLRNSRMMRELKLMRSDPPENIEAVPLDRHNYNWIARITGPTGSPYQGGSFYLNIKILDFYPLAPPVVRFITKIYHPNISRHGDIGIDCLGHNWTLALTIPQILLSIQSLLTDPCLDPCMEPEIAAQYVQNRRAFNATAQDWTWKYAMTDILLL